MTSDDVVVEFNVNEKVSVRLTDAGRAALQQEHDAIFADLPSARRPAYRPPVEDVDGWATFQMWDLMHRLGRACFMGAEVPFETTVRIHLASPSASADRGGLREKVAIMVGEDIGISPSWQCVDAILALVSPSLQQKGEET